MKEKTKLNEAYELEYSETPWKMSTYAYKHIFLHLNEQT